MTKTERPWLFRRSALSTIFFALALAGCEEGLSNIDSTPQAPSGDAVETVEIDVTAPHAFSIIDMALWDGRPTFGGVWIAYPDIEQPERVRIRNGESGKEVIAALYKREREFPGPKIELSADAAAALGVMAGTPAELTIVALRRKTVEVVVEAPVEELDMTTPLRRPVAEPATEPAVTTPSPRPAATTNIGTDIEESVLPPADGEGTYLQVSTLQTKSRAEEVVAQLRQAGLNAEIREYQTSDKTLYRIVVGPANSPEALEIMKRTVIKLRFKDAFVLR